ncbi:MAG: hypothetical protein UT05_C0006G0029 [Parcubacteria group bacterium GW2011_GWF2_38_76]|nr:MAG: hypothetical protein UT05_C0006G0029 [Parcubacteria group bacterium GW2011_GWF2_38_76]
MEKVRIFYDNPGVLEETVNKWLKEKGDKIEITRISQSQSQNSVNPPMLIVTIFYKDRK